MKKALRAAFACISLTAFSSCLSTPAAPATPESVPQTVAAPEASSTPASESTPTDASPAPESAVNPESPPVTGDQTAVASSDPAGAEPALAEPVSAEPASLEPVERPQVSDSEIAPPAAEKLLYFYPEPDPLYIAPVPPVASAKAEPVAKQAAKTEQQPAAKAATVKTEPAKAASAKTEPAKTDTPKTSSATNDVVPGIWTTEAVAPQSAQPVEAKTAAPSRSVQLAEGQNLEVWYPGSGWVYLGDASAQNGLEYQTRKLDKTDTLFTFRALKAGNYLLEFTRFDVLEDTFATDTLSVSVVVPEGKKTGKVRAPDYRSAVATVKNDAREVSSASSTQASSTTASAVTDEPSLVSVHAPANATVQSPAANAASLLESARKSLSSGDVSATLATLETFFSVAVDSIDEGLFLKGQAYEANSPARDIRKALDAYQTLVASWPESGRWNEADARIRYIKQFYMGR